MRSFLLGLVVVLTSIGSVFAQDNQPLNVAEWQSAVDILTGAKGAIVEHGWQQGATSPVTQECMSTAMERSWLNLKKSMVDFDYAKLALDRAIDAPAFSTMTSEDDPLSVPYWGRYFVYWNDASGRTEKEVLAAFDKAIAYASTQKNQAVEAKKTIVDLDSYDKKSMVKLGLLK